VSAVGSVILVKFKLASKYLDFGKLNIQIFLDDFISSTWSFCFNLVNGIEVDELRY
jgi:hypothetical protein